jgi:hypothetical protein
MLAYIALALGSLPPSRAHILRLFVLRWGVAGMVCSFGGLYEKVGVVLKQRLWQLSALVYALQDASPSAISGNT